MVFIRPLWCHGATLILMLCNWAILAAAQELPSATQTFLTNHCIDCHNDSTAEGAFDLTTLSPELAEPANFDQWVRLYDRVRKGEMPPPESEPPTDEVRSSFLQDTDVWLSEFQRTQWKESGRVHGKRLTNLQLERTLHDLLGIDIPLASEMPEEPRTSGFTTVADGQPMSHFQLQEHLKVVDLALDEAFQRASSGDTAFRKEFDAVGLSRRNPKQRTREPEVIDDLAVTWSSRLIFYGRIPATTAPESGWYRFTIRAKGLKCPPAHGVWCTVRTGRCISSAPLLHWVGAFEATEELQEWTFETWLPKGDMLEIRPGDDTLKMANFQGGQVGSGEGDPQNVPGVGIASLTMERIHLGPNSDQIRLLLYDMANASTQSSDSPTTPTSTKPVVRQQLEKLLLRFATRAFRSPVTLEEIEDYISFAMETFEAEGSFLSALRSGYRALLCSPKFLYFTESPGQLSDFALASRLSYFLWNRMPDDELMSVAQSGQLHDTQVLDHQIERMLAHPYGKSFVVDFASQWLDLKDIDFTTPDRRLYPQFDVIVQNSMLEETHAFLEKMLNEDLSVKRLIQADYTFLNERLARFYDIPGITGDKLQLTSLTPDLHRGGILTQGAILKVTANGTTTSPVIRGVWVSERLLGEEIPPPPSNVPAIEPDIRGATTIREQLEKHKNDTSCASCHRAIDPPGFALENFDPSGRWRERYGTSVTNRGPGAAIDPSYTLADGEAFESLREFQEIICRTPDKLAKNVASKLIAYGTGQPITFADRKEIARIVEKTQTTDFGFRSIIKEVIQSDLFRSK